MYKFTSVQISEDRAFEIGIKDVTKIERNEFEYLIFITPEEGPKKILHLPTHEIILAVETSGE